MSEVNNGTNILSVWIRIGAVPKTMLQTYLPDLEVGRDQFYNPVINGLDKGGLKLLLLIGIGNRYQSRAI